ncbi:MAG TPA: hypothetical protein PKK95_13395, partial [Vicinamibacterales bacterium]|nr:hypothetical protein [Vicinamibacterales bacterium]
MTHTSLFRARTVRAACLAAAVSLAVAGVPSVALIRAQQAPPVQPLPPPQQPPEQVPPQQQGP